MTEILSHDPMDKVWQQVRPDLDDVMHELSEKDRTAVVLRYFDGRSLKDVGLALGLTENAARMRVERALEKLRTLLSRRGVKTTASSLATVLAIGAVLSAPPALASTVSTGALAAAIGGTGTFVLANLLAVMKTKTAAVGTLMALMAAFVMWERTRSNRTATEKVPSVQTDSSSAILASDSKTHDDSSTQTNTTAPAQMILQVVEAETGKPLADAKLHLFYLRQDGRGERVKRITDANGKLAVDGLARPFHGLNMFVTADGHVPKVTSWWDTDMPAEYTMRLEKGATVGGIIVDEAGQLITGARVGFDGPGSNSASQDNIQFGPDTTIVTDLQGRWSCNMVPKELDKLTVKVTHADFAEASAVVRPHSPEANSIIITMSAGFRTAGVVQDFSGNPIGEAKVREVRRNSESEKLVTTDGLGAFEFRHMKPGEFILAAEAEGYAPVVQTLQITGNVSEIRFQLVPGQILRGHVRDENGNPVAKAFVETTRGRNNLKWSTTTDADGVFQWDSAPQEPLLYSFQAEGFNYGWGIKLQADGSEHQVTLTHERPDKDKIQITGTAEDGETGKPLDTFKVLRSDGEPDWSFPFEFAGTGKDGMFSLSFPAKESHPDYRIQIEKEGYYPVISKTYSRKDGGQTIAFKLHQGSGPSGVALLPNGDPVSNAVVLQCTPEGGVTIDGPAHVEVGPSTTVYRSQTDAAGKFSLAGAVDPQGLIVVHEQGFGAISMADFEAKGEIILQPWGKVEGTLILDSQPIANERIVAANNVARYDATGRRFGFMTFYLEARSDSGGKFFFDKIPPGQCEIFRQSRSTSTGFESHDTSVMVKAGEVTQVALGGTGRTVVGRLLLNSGADRIDWQRVPVCLRLKTSEEPGSRPKRADFSSIQEYIVAADRFFDTRDRHRYGAFCGSDGSFRLQDVPAGSYELEIKVRASNALDPEDSLHPTEIGSLSQTILVSENPSGQVDQPLDLGTLVMVSRPEPR